MDRFTRWTLVVVAGIVALAVWTSTRSPEAIPGPDDHGPVTTARAWLTALATGHPEDAWELLAPEVQAREARSDFIRRHSMVVPDGPSSARIRIDAVVVTGDEARVEVVRTVGATADFPFWRSTFASERVVLRLRSTDGRWRITVAPDAP